MKSDIMVCWYWGEKRAKLCDLLENFCLVKLSCICCYKLWTGLWSIVRLSWRVFFNGKYYNTILLPEIMYLIMFQSTKTFLKQFFPYWITGCLMWHLHLKSMVWNHKILNYEKAEINNITTTITAKPVHWQFSHFDQSAVILNSL